MKRVTLCQRNKSRGILIWYARIFDPDTKEIRYESLKTTKKTEAQYLMQDKIKMGEYDDNPHKTEITLRKAVDEYLQNLNDKGASSYSFANFKMCLNYLTPLFDEKLSEISKNSLLDTFLKATENLKASSRNQAKMVIKSAFKFFVNVKEYIPRNIAEILPTSKGTKKEKDFWTLEQIDKILNNAPDKNTRLFWAFMAFAGLRYHEAKKVAKSDIKDGYLQVLGKGQKWAKIPISSRLNKEIELCNNEWNFSKMRSGHSILQRAVNIALPEGYAGKANYHRFRHSFASNLIRAGVGVKQCQKLLRHSNITTTLNIYSHLLDEDLSDSIEKMFK